MIAQLVLSAALLSGSMYDDLVAPVFLMPERGTAVAISESQLLTVAHCVHDDDAVLRIQVAPGDVREAKVLRVDRRADLALLSLPGHGRKPIAIADSSPEPLVGVWLVACPTGITPTPVKGYVGGPLETIVGALHLRVVAGTFYGSSGGAVIDPFGRLVGIQSKSRGNRFGMAQFVAFAVALPEIKRFLKNEEGASEWQPIKRTEEDCDGDGDEDDETGLEKVQAGVVYDPAARAIIY